MKARFASSVALGAALLLLGTGCTSYGPIIREYVANSPADGTSATVGFVLVRNALLISDEGEQASLAMAVSNEGPRQVVVQFEYNFEDGTPRQFSLGLEPGELISFGSEFVPPILLEDLDVLPGGDLAMFVQYGDQTGEIMRVPIYDGRLDYYDQLEPELPSAIDPEYNPPVEVAPEPGAELEEAGQ